MWRDVDLAASREVRGPEACHRQHRGWKPTAANPRRPTTAVGESCFLLASATVMVISRGDTCLLMSWKR